MMTMIASFRKTSDDVDDDPTLAGAGAVAVVVVDVVVTLDGSCGWSWVYY